MTRILAIETSCDETSVALFRPPRTIEANLLFSQVEIHRPFGGIVPELASRSHVERLLPLMEETLDLAGVGLGDVDVIAATRGPGLLGALLVGLGAAQGLAFGLGRPFLGINHLHGHLLSPDLEEAMRFPALVLLASGGHTALYWMTDERSAWLLKRTVDDAVGEAFDKVAKLSGLPYPGGPAVEGAARDGDPTAFDLPRPRPKDPAAFSLSGLKTAVRRQIEWVDELSEHFVADLAASFQAAVGDMLAGALDQALSHHDGARGVYLVGGVARNRHISGHLTAVAEKHGLDLRAPSPVYCTDNAAMIARAAWSRYRGGERDGWDLQPRSRWEFGRWEADE